MKTSMTALQIYNLSNEFLQECIEVALLRYSLVEKFLEVKLNIFIVVIRILVRIADGVFHIFNGYSQIIFWITTRHLSFISDTNINTVIICHQLYLDFGKVLWVKDINKLIKSYKYKKQYNQSLYSHNSHFVSPLLIYLIPWIIVTRACEISSISTPMYSLVNVIIYAEKLIALIVPIFKVILIIHMKEDTESSRNISGERWKSWYM